MMNILMKQIKIIVFISTGALLCACGGLKDTTPSSDTFMVYELNGKTITLDTSFVVLRPNDPTRYSIAGTSTARGDTNGIIIQHAEGPPSQGEYKVSQKLVLILGGQKGTFSTLDVKNPSSGEGQFSIIEMSDGYIEGTFKFKATDLSDKEKRVVHTVTDGRFKSRIDVPLF